MNGRHRAPQPIRWTPRGRALINLIKGIGTTATLMAMIVAIPFVTVLAGQR